MESQMQGFTNKKQESYSLTPKNSGMVNSTVKRKLRHKVKETGLNALLDRRYKEAAKLYELELMVEPENPHLHYEYGLALYHLGRIEESLREYKKTVSLDPNYERAYHNMGVIF